MPTLKDVARDAGVSIATVSCCLSGSRQVKPETKMRVMDSIEKLKYIPNAAARNLKSANSNRIGIVMTNIDNSYHAEILEGISSYLQKHGYTINVAFSNSSPDVECAIIDDFISQNMSGLLLITSQPQNTEFFTNRIQNYGIPAVFVERRPSNMDISFVGYDNYKTGYHLTEQLLQKHYRRIAVVAGSPQYSSESEFIRGYTTAFNNYNIPLDQSLIQYTNMTKEDAFKTVITNLDLDTLEAVLATSENITAGILEAFHLQGIQVGRDVQLFTLSEESWNRSSRVSHVLHTSRTSFTLGTAAARLLAQHIDSPVLFEEQSLLFTDDILHTELEIKPPAVKTPFAVGSARTETPLRILMVDLATSHSAQFLSRDFTRKTGIPVDIDFVSHNEVLQHILDDLARSKHYYDIYMYDVPWLQYMVQNGLVADITDFVQHSSFRPEQLFKENMENCCYENHYYGIPIIGGAQIMFYRKDIFENRNLIKSFKNKYKISLRPPRTWTEFNRTAEFFTRSYNPVSPTQFGTSFAGIVDEELAPEILIRLWAYGGSLWDRYNRVSLNTPENTRAFQSILQTLRYVEKSPLETSINQTVEDFSSGKTAMLVTYTEYAAQISNSISTNIIGRVGYETLPGRTPVSIGWNFGLNPYTSMTDAAYSYFNWLCQNNTSYYMTIMDGQSPVVAPYHSHELLKLYPWLELTEKSFDYCCKRTGPYRNRSLVIPQNRIEAILCSVLKDIITQNMTIPDALAKGQTEMEALFKSYGYPKPLHFI